MFSFYVTKHSEVGKGMEIAFTSINCVDEFMFCEYLSIGYYIPSISIVPGFLLILLINNLCCSS